MWSGSPGPFMARKGAGRGGGMVLRNLHKRAARRASRPGYPVEPYRMSVEEADAYVAGDRVECLLCGKSYRSLIPHLRSIHGLTGDQYRERYGLPYRVGLAAADFRAAQGRRAAAMIAEGKVDLTPYQHLCRGVPGRHSAYKASKSTRNVLQAGHEVVYGPDDYAEFLRRMLSGRSAEEVGQDQDMPSPSHWRHRLRQDKAFRQQVAAALEAAPFPVQAACQRLGRRFKAEVDRLRLQGLSVHEIGRRLGVHAMTVQLRIEAPLPRQPPAAVCGKGHPKEPGRHCTICNTEAVRKRRGSLPRAVYRALEVEAPCPDCGTVTVVNKAALDRQGGVLCTECARIRQRANERAYKQRVASERRGD